MRARRSGTRRSQRGCPTRRGAPPRSSPAGKDTQSGGHDEQLGDRLPEPRPSVPTLLVDAIAAARRDTELAALLRERLARRESMLAGVVARAKHDGTVTDAISTDAFARFAAMLATGALVFRSLEIAQPDPDEWHALIARLLDALEPTALEPTALEPDVRSTEETHE